MLEDLLQEYEERLDSEKVSTNHVKEDELAGQIRQLKDQVFSIILFQYSLLILIQNEEFMNEIESTRKLAKNLEESVRELTKERDVRSFSIISLIYASIFQDLKTQLAHSSADEIVDVVPLKSEIANLKEALVSDIDVFVYKHFQYFCLERTRVRTCIYRALL